MNSILIVRICVTFLTHLVWKQISIMSFGATKHNLSLAQGWRISSLIKGTPRWSESRRPRGARNSRPICGTIGGLAASFRSAKTQLTFARAGKRVECVLLPVPAAIRSAAKDYFFRPCNSRDRYLTGADVFCHGPRNALMCRFKNRAKFQILVDVVVYILVRTETVKEPLLP